MLLESGSCLVAAYAIWKPYVGVSRMLVLIKYFNIYVCAFVGMNNEQYKMHIMYLKIVFTSFIVSPCIFQFNNG